MLALLVVFLGTASIASSSYGYDNVGHCLTVEPQIDFDIEKFSTECDGYWKIVMRPACGFVTQYTSISLSTKSTGQHREYNANVTFSNYETGNHLTIEEIVNYKGKGRSTAITKEDEQYKLYYMKYKYGRYMYYYACSTHGHDPCQYRYVCAHGCLTKEEVKEILYLDKCNFPDMEELEWVGEQH